MGKVILFLAGFYAFSVFAQDDSLIEEKSSKQIEQLETDSNILKEEFDITGDDKISSENNDDEVKEENSDSRFIPTEQISQDLGVSFPVDI
tara:strand:- start:295 stop:567 length:273 start_codon:yes stop_codon:yes gene_type:complete